MVGTRKRMDAAVNNAAQHDPTRYDTSNRNGPRKLDSAVSEILHGIQAAKLRLAWSKYTSSGVRRSSAL